MCLPKSCTIEDAKTLDSNIISMMEDLNWTDVSVNYTMASQFKDTGIKEAVSDSMNIFTWLLLLFFVLLGMVGMLFELTKLGDIEGLNYEELEP